MYRGCKMCYVWRVHLEVLYIGCPEDVLCASSPRAGLKQGLL